MLNRDSGILLHVTSLPSQYGIGDLGQEAFRFLDFLERSSQGLWQVLPLNPPDQGDSPYHCFSAFAGNPLIIGVDPLVKWGLLTGDDVQPIPRFPQEEVDFNTVRVFKDRLLKKAFQCVKNGRENQEYLAFVKENEFWLPDYALFIALKKHFCGAPWYHWDEALAHRDKKTLEHYTDRLIDEIKYQKFLQFIFFQQWSRVKKYAETGECV